VVTAAVAVIGNLTSTGGGGHGYLAAYPANDSVPGVSTLNFIGDSVANSCIAGLSSAGQIAVFAGADATDFLFDVTGFIF
jgi:hypothetical protein